MYSENIPAQYITEKWLISRTYKELLQINMGNLLTQKTNTKEQLKGEKIPKLIDNHKDRI